MSENRRLRGWIFGFFDSHCIFQKVSARKSEELWMCFTYTYTVA